MDMPDIHLVVPDDLLDAFKAASAGVDRTVSQQLRALMRDFVESVAKPVKPLTGAQTKAAKVAANQSASAAKIMLDGLPDGWTVD